MSIPVQSAHTSFLSSYQGAVLPAGWAVLHRAGRGLLARTLRALRFLPGPYSVF